MSTTPDQIARFILDAARIPNSDGFIKWANLTGGPTLDINGQRLLNRDDDSSSVEKVWIALSQLYELGLIRVAGDKPPNFLNVQFYQVTDKGYKFV